MHPSWDTVESNQRDAYRATIKAKLLIGTYNLRETVLSSTNLILTHHVCCVMEILKQESIFLPTVQHYTNRENPFSNSWMWKHVSWQLVLHCYLHCFTNPSWILLTFHLLSQSAYLHWVHLKIAYIQAACDLNCHCCFTNWYLALPIVTLSN